MNLKVIVIMIIFRIIKKLLLILNLLIKLLLFYNIKHVYKFTKNLLIWLLLLIIANEIMMNLKILMFNSWWSIDNGINQFHFHIQNLLLLLQSGFLHLAALIERFLMMLRHMWWIVHEIYPIQTQSLIVQ